ncbi:MAG: RHS repeat-associated core domain-containing protein [Candidatus Obscuribacter sp.]|nr:RHS repeat-associated core domain-containing protein [Candidatus Obscuribacter sp.]MBK9277469.1 RHS repeat-associated core domain-containing protein [Candidatus Obscuribacter sp.]
MQKSDSMAPEYELDGHASSLIYAFKRGAKHLTDIFAYSKWTLPQKGSLLVDHVIISNCPSTLSYGTADNVNKYPSVGGVGYSYNGNKCLTGDGVWTFGYDTENHLLTASKTGTSASFVYDPMHRQSQKTVGSTKTRYVYSGWQRIADYNGSSGALQRRYVYGTGLDEPLIIVTGTTPTFLHHDKVGSIVAVSNNSGAVANKNKFSPFGEITTLGGTTVGFTGQRYDSELGLYYFKHRYYSPKLGRFLQPDPIGYTGRDFNLYTYVGNSPQKYTDPMGLQWCWIPGTGDPVDSYIPWYDNPTGMSGADWFAQFGLTFAQGARFDWGRNTGDGATPGLINWLVPGAQRSPLFGDEDSTYGIYVPALAIAQLKGGVQKDAPGSNVDPENPHPQEILPPEFFPVNPEPAPDEPGETAPQGRFPDVPERPGYPGYVVPK